MFLPIFLTVLAGYLSEKPNPFVLSVYTLHTYRISSYSFRGNYSFLNLEIQRSQYIRPKVTVHKCAETIQGRKLFKGGNYRRKYGIKRGKYAFFAGYSIIDGYEVCFKFLYYSINLFM